MPVYISIDSAEIGTTISSSVLAIKATPGTLDIVESLTTTILNTAGPVVFGTDRNAPVNSTVFAVDSRPATMTLVESLTTTILNTAGPVVFGGDQNANVNSTVLTSITHAFTDATPVVPSTGTSTVTQTWTVS